VGSGGGGTRIDVAGVLNDKRFRSYRALHEGGRPLEIGANLCAEHYGGRGVEHSGDGCRAYGGHAILQRGPYDATGAACQLWVTASAVVSIRTSPSVKKRLELRGPRAQLHDVAMSRHEPPRRVPL